MVNLDSYVQKKPTKKVNIYTGTFLSTVKLSYSTQYTNQRQIDIIQAECANTGHMGYMIADQLTSRLSQVILESTPLNQGLSVQACSTEIKSSQFCEGTPNLWIPLSGSGKQGTAVIPLSRSQLHDTDYVYPMSNLQHVTNHQIDWRAIAQNSYEQ